MLVIKMLDQIRVGGQDLGLLVADMTSMLHILIGIEMETGHVVNELLLCERILLHFGRAHRAEVSLTLLGLRIWEYRLRHSLCLLLS